MTEYGIFNDEGCLEAGFYDEQHAKNIAASLLYADDPNVYVAEMCPDHEEQPHDNCEECDDE